MYARVAKWEGVDAQELREMAEGMKKESGPPEGVPSTRFLMLVDESAGTSYGIAFFDSEEDLRTGDEALNEMTPPTGSTGSRVSVDLCEVFAELTPEASA